MDEYIHKIYQRSQIGYQYILKKFGRKYVSQHAVNRPALRKLVFNDSQALRKLNHIMIPLMQEKLVSLKQLDKLIFVELAILLNNQQAFKKYFNKIILILGSNKIEKKLLNRFFNGVKNLSTKSVGKYKNPIKTNIIKYDFLVDNSTNKRQFLEQLKEVSKHFPKK
jgi:dephospho-CoA kinase